MVIQKTILYLQHEFKTTGRFPRTINKNAMITVTFWKADFAGGNLEQLIAILKQYAVKGIGSWFIDKTNFIIAGLEDEQSYIWIMENVANYGNIEINK